MNEKTIKIDIKEMSNDDLIKVAKVHIRAFPKSFLSKLGTGAVKRYYDWQMNGPHSHYSIVAEVDGQVVGFCVGGISRGAMIGFLKKYKFYLAAKLLSKFYLLLNKNLLSKFLGALKIFFKKMFFAEENKIEKRTSDTYGILAICVLPEMQGAGVAKELMVESENKAKEKGFLGMHLTVESNNTRAIRFYEKLGYFKVLEKSNEHSVFMQKELNIKKEP